MSVLSVSLRVCMFEGEGLKGNIGSCVAESLSTMVLAMALGWPALGLSGRLVLNFPRPARQPSSSTPFRIVAHLVSQCQPTVEAGWMSIQ